MRIGFFTSVKGWGGSEMYIKTMLLSLRQEGHDPVLMGVEGSRLFQELQNEGVECVVCKSVRRVDPCLSREEKDIGKGRRGLKSTLLRYLPGGLKLLAGSVRAAQHLRTIINASRLDVLQVNVGGYEVAGLASKLARVKVIGFFHSSPVNEPDPMRRWLIRQTGRRYDRLCFPSEFTAKAWATLLNVDSAICSVVPYGIDVQRFSCLPQASRRASDPFRLVSVARLHPMKGYPCLIDAIAELKDQRVTLDILGEGNEMEALGRQIARLGLQGQVRLRGHEEQPEAIIQEAHAFILLSNSHESFGMAVVEAMAAGLPLITSAYGPFPEINEHGVTGLVVPVGSTTETAKAIKTLANDPELCRNMGSRGQARAQALYQKESMVCKMTKLYEDLHGCNTI